MSDDVNAAIVRDLAARPPDYYEEWLEPVKGPGRICPLCLGITKEGPGNDTSAPMPLEHHGPGCTYRRAVEAAR